MTEYLDYPTFGVKPFSQTFGLVDELCTAHGQQKLRERQASRRWHKPFHAFASVFNDDTCVCVRTRHRANECVAASCDWDRGIVLGATIIGVLLLLAALLLFGIYAIVHGFSWISTAVAFVTVGAMTLAWMLTLHFSARRFLQSHEKENLLYQLITVHNVESDTKH